MRILSKTYLATWSTELLESQLKSIDLQIKKYSNPYSEETGKYENRFLQLHRISIDIKKELQTR